METGSREKLFWLGCGLFIIVAAKGISWQLREAARLSHIAADKARDADEPQSTGGSNEDKEQGTEDAISLETLAVLIDHPNYDIRQVARKIVLNRFANNDECCRQLATDYFIPDKQTEAAAVLNELFYVADRDSLIRTPYSGNSETSNITIDGILRAAAQNRPDRRGSGEPVLTVEEVGGDNGEVTSLRLDGGPGFGDLQRLLRSESPAPEHEPEDDEIHLPSWRQVDPTAGEDEDAEGGEMRFGRHWGEIVEAILPGARYEDFMPQLRSPSPLGDEENILELAQRRARRREAMVVELDGDEGFFELRQPL